jgi:hypothetical protein
MITMVKSNFYHGKADHILGNPTSWPLLWRGVATGAFFPRAKQVCLRYITSTPCTFFAEDVHTLFRCAQDTVICVVFADKNPPIPYLVPGLYRPGTCLTSTIVFTRCCSVAVGHDGVLIFH